MVKKYTLKYRRLTVRLSENPRKGKCTNCPREGKTDMHHWTYAYPTKDVKANPELALDNTIELCFVCHQIANALKKVVENMPLALSMIIDLPDELYDKWNWMGEKDERNCRTPVTL